MHELRDNQRLLVRRGSLLLMRGVAAVLAPGEYAVLAGGDVAVGGAMAIEVAVAEGRIFSRGLSI